MGIFSRLKMGWTLSKDSLSVLRHHPDLTLFPLLSGLAGIVFLGLLFGGSVVLNLFGGNLGYVALFVMYTGSAFIAAFFNAALVYSTREAFQGRNPTLRSGLDAAWEQRKPLFVWSAISATVGILLRVIEGQDNAIARIAASLFSVAWSIVTYFIIPVIVFEDVGVTEMFTRSGETFKQTWGETAGASFGVGLITVVFMLLGLVFAGLLLVLLQGGLGFVLALGVAILVVLLTGLLGTTLGAIAKTALYVYATEGERPPEFDNVDFEAGAR